MVVYALSDASELKDASLEADPNTLIFILFYDRASKQLLKDVETLSDDSDFVTCKFHASDADESDELADEYKIKHFPTCVLMKGGEIVGNVRTPRDVGVIREVIEKNLADGLGQFAYQ